MGRGGKKLGIGGDARTLLWVLCDGTWVLSLVPVKRVGELFVKSHSLRYSPGDIIVYFIYM